jgi:hypothetical protein
MARFSFLALLALPLVQLVVGAPIPNTPAAAVSKRAFKFISDYDTFQISDGVGGDAEKLANALFVDPFQGVDLATVDAQTVDDLETMRSAAEDAETERFNPAIDDTEDEATADALQVGKIKNKVLKLTGITQKIKIQIAQAQADGDDTASLEKKLAEEQKKLTKNIQTDKDSAGEPSLAAP